MRAVGSRKISLFSWAARVLAPVLAPVLALAASCVPEGPATTGAGAPEPPKTAALVAPPPKPKGDSGSPPSRPPITAPFEDTFDRADLGPDWFALSPAWKITAGRLCVRGARNRGIWLARKIPVNARIEFDAFAEAADGDLKVEAWGDGVSGATGTSYSNATSYLLILGGWKNSKHVLARLDEHGEGRLEIDVEPGADDERARPVEVGQPYRFKIEREDGKTVTWSVNGLDYFEFVDPEPLAGPGHEHVGFNDWDAPVCFDNVKVTPL
jgi:hypothetical protein